ncbi:unnamed protein product [Spirodela intermedia]|uniref:O-fucosyltransferase family protein n=1 Tax=Spirodela intermedia TaxID=51605 RepID=A0A7I8KAF5_SPIIN|nr:unnamed protein product [Spirodela intermedia]
MPASTDRRRPRRGTAVAPLGSLLVLFLPGFCNPLAHASPSTSSGWHPPPTPSTHRPLLNGALETQETDGGVSSWWSPWPSQGWGPCVGPKATPVLPKNTPGFVQVFLDGGISQQRMGICDAVAVAKILNATLVVPHLEVNPVWKDSSTFGDIFDVDKFIEVLEDEVPIVRSLPEEYSWSTREYYAMGIRATRIKTAPVRASADWYLENVLPVLRRYGIAAISPFSHRLAFHNLPEGIQQLRCKVNFQALTFVPHIVDLGEALVERLRNPVHLETRVASESPQGPSNKSAGRFVALHLRFDKDMVAHSACDFGGGKAEKLALARYRKHLWHGRLLNSQFTNKELRKKGRCPLTPEEIGLMLAAMGFDGHTRLFLATHKVYGGRAQLAPLRKLFPLMEDKRSLASEEELGRVNGRASLLAAVDYYVSIHSDIFVSASPSNMHNAVVGSRTYGGLKTIRPDMALLGRLFLNKTLGWEEFRRMVRAGHGSGQRQITLRMEKQSIYTYPAPDCMCRV